MVSEKEKAYTSDSFWDEILGLVKPLADNVEVVVTTFCKEGLEMLQKHFPSAKVYPMWFSINLVIFSLNNYTIKWSTGMKR